MNAIAETAEISMPPLKTLLRVGGVVCRVDAITEGDKLYLTDIASTENRTCHWPVLRSAMSRGVVSLAEDLAVEQALMVPVHLRAREQSLIEGIPVTGNSYGTLLRCIDEGGIPGASYTVDLAKGKKTFNIPPAVYRSIVQAMQQTDTIEAGAAQLGCSVDAMRGLVASGCVTARKLALTRHGRNGDRVCPADLRSFAEFLFRAAKTEDGPHLERLYFSWWVPGAYNAYRCKWWRKILGAVKEKRIALFKAALAPIALNDLYVLRSDLRNLLGARCVP